ncbi:MAG: translocase [Bacilli bacterium]|nr:translocase [Bacilli bacterium]
MFRELFTPGHILLIVIVALLFFGPAKLPELGRGVGKMLREFKSGAKELYTDEDPAASTKNPPQKELNDTTPQIVEAKQSEREHRLP